MMKRLFFVATLLMGLAATADAQAIASNALGIRAGDNDGFGTEISYQAGLGGNNRMEFDLGWRSGKGYTGYQLAALYQWVMPLDKGFHWYIGVGGGVGSIDFDNNNTNGETFFFAAGDIGIEYNFNIPLLISLDFRPELGFGDFRDDVDFDVALGLRFQF